MIVRLSGEGNTVKQVQLAAAVAHRLNVQKFAKSSEEQRVKDALFHSVKQFYEDINDKHSGRYSNQNRAALMTVNSIVEGPIYVEAIP